MLNADLKQQLKTYLQNLRQDVRLVVSADDSKKSQELLDLANDISSLSPLVSVTQARLERTPEMQVTNAQGTDIRFAGLPMGHEFTSLVLALLHTGGHPLKLDMAVIEQIKALPQTLKFETFISLSCQNCPDVVQALNMMAALNPNVSSTMIDGALFQDEVESRQIMAVPSVFLNGELFSQGRISLKEILAKVDTQAAAREADALSEKAPYEVLVVGAEIGRAHV